MAKFRAVPQPRSEDDFVNGAALDGSLPKEPAPKEPALPKEAAPIVEPAAADDLAERRPKNKAQGRATPARFTRGSRPWHEFSADERPTISQTVRLNTYQHEQLKWLAQNEDRSLAQVLRRLLAPVLEQATKQ